MIKWIQTHFIITLSLLFLSACSLQPAKHLVQVEVDPNQFVQLPTPASFGQDINVSQLITAKWGEEAEQQMLVQLQIDQQQIVLAGFSAWGAKLLSLTYANNEIQTYVLSGFSETLPKPEQVLFNVMLSIWPIETWQVSLDNIGWKLQEIGLQRQLLDDKGEVVVIIDYQNKPYLDGKITFKHLRLNYVVIIETTL